MKYLFANWKMYLDYDESNILANALANEHKKIPESVKVAVFPSALSLYPVAQVLNDVGIGVGERRHQFHETNHEVRQKLEAALTVGLIPVLCVGETLKEREENKTEEVIEVQLRAAFENLSWPVGRELIVAYEPVWAISKGMGASDVGLPCDEIEAERIHILIAKMVKGILPEVDPVVLFGGSVRKETVAGYLSQPHIHGVLVGAASTRLDSWLEIMASAIN
ncbi:MAG: Triosephosphate isomerase [Candidatus Magasanikbacteria bacterium GW2011_GWA2_37_8]|uniref:Triosephosphate isomerase n=1 Tax=Candidatus Magasanikbacteria bacterium GW2011_GWA2_37_8 TaxID=1619036 RepID=A0A0G0HCS9_9BACT|nr:MAG: Triosephosphate isomerase [Candidatus Magasanikbacteria bacterium GW2011_GWA2_37_8]